MSWCWCSVLELPQKITPTIPFLHFHYIPNIFTLRKGYVFTGVPDSVNRGGCIPACTGAGTPPHWAVSQHAQGQTPFPAADGTHPTGMHSC